MCLLLVVLSDIYGINAETIPQVLTRLSPFEGLSDIQILLKLSRGLLPARPGSAILEPIDEVDGRMWNLLNHCWSAEVEMRPTCREILQELGSDAFIRQFRDASPLVEGSTQEVQQFQHTMGKISSVPIDLNQVGQILEELYCSQGEPVQFGTWRGEWGYSWQQLEPPSVLRHTWRSSK